MDDYLSERDQWEALKGWLKENGAWIVAGIVIGVGILYGWRWWQDRVNTRAQTAAARYLDVVNALDTNNPQRALEVTEELRKEYSDTPYVDQADLALAREHVEQGQLDEAMERLRRVMTETEDDQLRHVAALRLARVQIAQGKPDEALATLNRVKEPGAFDPRYTEIRGDALLARGDREGALAQYRRAAQTANTEPGLVDEGLLQLKINDLASSGAAPAKPEAAAGDAPAKADAPAGETQPKPET